MTRAVRALNPLVTAPPMAMRSGLPKVRHRTRLGAGPGGVMHSKPSTRLDPNRPRRERPAVKIPSRIRNIRGLTSDEALLALADMARLVPSDQAIVELGVYQGKSLLTLAWGATLGNHAHAWGIDPWDLMTEPNEDISYLGKDFNPYNHEGNRRWAEWHVKSLGYSRSATLVHNFSTDVGYGWEGPPVGLLYVDGDHSYEGVMGDVAAWSPHLAPGATIVFDDYVSGFADTVIRAIEELVTDGTLEPIQLHAGRLAVTRLTGGSKAPGDIEPAGESDPEGDRRPGDGENDPAWDGVEQEHRVEVDEAQRLPTTTDTEVISPEPAEQSPDYVADERLIVMPKEAEELGDVGLQGARIEELNTVQLRALAKARGIKLGIRKDKRDAMLDALRAGE